MVVTLKVLACAYYGTYDLPIANYATQILYHGYGLPLGISKVIFPSLYSQYLNGPHE